jgi:hypothetical protein
VSIRPRVKIGTKARRRLAELGLESEWLLDSARRGMAAAAGCTPNHPAVLLGILGWGETICALRDHLVPRGWQRLDEGNLPLAVNEAKTVALTVATGDEDTGRPDGNPCTKFKKGPRVASAVANNQLQLFPVPVHMRPDEATGRATWLLLIHRDRVVRELRTELSRPVSMGEDGRVDAWSERILMGAVPFDDQVIVEPTSPNDSSPDIVVEIKRRA